jgi:hypothetical protein
MHQTIRTETRTQLPASQNAQEEITIEQVLKSKYAVYLQHKHLIENLFNIEES